MRLKIVVGALLMSSTAVAAETEWKLVIHGGAGVIQRSSMTPEKDRDIRAALDRALQAGENVLASGGKAIDAVEATARVLEDDPNFNAGRGAVLTDDRRHELDASIMDGATRAAGAVAGVSGTRNPISLARAVMEKSPHVFLSGDGADAFSREQGLEQVPNSYFSTPERREQLQRFKTSKVSAMEVEYKYGTIGAVALDSHGHVAAATSTGGMTGKKWSRIGDSPVIGAGSYADDRACAVSATGHGEYFIRVGVAHEICTRIRMGMKTERVECPPGDGANDDFTTCSVRRRLDNDQVRAIAHSVLAEVESMGGTGGVIVVTPQGEMVQAFNTPGMYRGMASKAGRSVAIYSEDEER